MTLPADMEAVIEDYRPHSLSYEAQWAMNKYLPFYNPPITDEQRRDEHDAYARTLDSWKTE